MKVSILRAYGDRYGRQHKAGDVAEFPDHIAVKLIGNGTALPVREPQVETATAAPAEKVAGTTKPKTRKGAAAAAFSPESEAE